MKLVKRSAWGARASRGSDYLGSTRGVKVHFTGSPENPAMGEPDGHHLCDDRVRSIQNGHMDGNGWNDIGYSALVCGHGYVYVGRGPHVVPAANGPGLNSGHYAVCGLVGSKGLTEPTPAMLHGIRDAIEWLRREGDAGNEIKGHRDGYATDCPGGPLYRWVKAGAPRPDEEDDMPSVAEFWKHPVVIPEYGREEHPDEKSIPAEGLLRGAEIKIHNVREEVRELAGEVAGIRTDLAEIKALLTPKES